MPGVVVTLSGGQGFDFRVTDEAGEARFFGLAPDGAYFLEATREDCNPVPAAGVTVSAGRSTQVDVELMPNVPDLNVVYTGASPLLDRRRVGAGTTVSRIELEKIFATRDPWGLLPSIPGVLTGRAGSGGRRIGLPSPAVGPGAPADQAVWSLDGVILSDRATRGTFPAIDLGSLQEIYVTAGGDDARIAGSGLSVNLITRRGSNEWRASVRSFSGDHTTDRGVEGGGPLRKGQSWIWASAARLESGDRSLRTGALALDSNAGDSNTLAARVWDGDAPEPLSHGRSGFGGRPAVWKIEDTQRFLEGSTLTGLYARVAGDFPQQQARLDGASAFSLRSTVHDVRYGGASRSVLGGHDGVDRVDRGDRGEAGTSSLYAQDLLLFGHLSTSLGLRWDRQTSRLGGTTAVWTTFAPRLGLTWSLGSSGRTLLSGAYTRRADQLGAVTAGNASQLVDPRLRAPKTDEVLLGVQHKLAKTEGMVLGLQLTWRRTRDVLDQERLVDDGGALRPDRCDDYLPVTTPVLLPGGTPAIATWWELRPGLATANESLLTNGRREQQLRGATLSVTRLLASRWMLRGFLSWQDWTWRIPPGAVHDPTETLTGGVADGTAVLQSSDMPDLLLQSRWSYGLSGLYRLAPDQPWGFDVAANWTGRHGYPLRYALHVQRATIADPGGLDVPVVADPGAWRQPDVHLLDLRLQRELSWQDFGLLLSLDVLNALNRSIVLRSQNLLGQPGQSDTGRSLEAVSPRLYRFGVRLSYR